MFALVLVERLEARGVLTAAPDRLHLSPLKGDGVMFVWRLSSELQQSMQDRMCELRPAGATTRSGGIGTTGDSVGGTSECHSSGSSGRPTVAAAAKVRR